MNPIIVSFSDNYKSIFIDRAPYKHKNWQFYGISKIHFQISLFSPHMQNVLFQLENAKNNVSSKSD